VSRPILFIDDGGVLNENRRRSQQWQTLVGEYLVPRLGGTPEAWAVANASVIDVLVRDYISHFEAEPEARWSEYWADYDEDWLQRMCWLVDVSAPAHAAERRRLSRACGAYVTSRVRAAYPGAASAIRHLDRAGYVLHTASGEVSWELDGYLTGMGVRDSFDRLYGPDQVDVAKSSPRYYESIFADVAIGPAEALVIDDNERALNWAAEVGAQTVLCGAEAPLNPRHGHIFSLAALPDFLRACANRTRFGSERR
jgi:phosphoglycolate phosphatase-like HAD superfamily hydrolase